MHKTYFKKASLITLSCLAIFVTLFFSGINSNNTTAHAFVNNCFDSDVTSTNQTGRNYATKGYITYGASGYNSDMCSGNISLVEFYCVNGTPAREIVSCPNGCSNGVCIQTSLINLEPSITITSPSPTINSSGIPSWQKGTTHTITWTSSNVDLVNIILGNNTINPPTITTIATNITASTGTFTWTIPSTQAPGNYFVKVLKGGNAQNMAYSQAAPVTIVAGSSPTCTPNWQTGTWGTCTGGQQTRTVTDANNCGITTNKPATTQSCTVTCTPNWQVSAWNTCVNGQQTRTVTDINSCGVTTNKPATTQSCTVTPVNKGIVSLSFDDGYLSTYQNAIPILNAAGYKSTQYIISGAVGDTADGYITQQQMLDMQAQGHEIGSHTKTHPNLTTLNTTQLTDEILGSRQALQSMGVNTVSSFTYPYGVYSTEVEQVVKNSGYSNARTVNGGSNDKTTDPYLLTSRAVERGGICGTDNVPTTTLAEVQGWIDSAAANKNWLILTFHQTDNISTNCYGDSPAMLQSIVNYLKTSNVNVATVSQGLQLINQ